jgi:hypothetical protein
MNPGHLHELGLGLAASDREAAFRLDQSQRALRGFDKMVSGVSLIS